MSFEILMNGVGNAFSRVHWGTSFVVRDGSFCLAVDCPDSYLRALAANDFDHEGDSLGVDDIDGIFITHLHGDHVNGLEMTLAYRRNVVGDPMAVYATPPVANDLWDRRLAVALERSWDGENYEALAPDDYYELYKLPWDEEAEVGPFTLTPRQTLHHIPTAAVRIGDGDATLGYSCDTAFDESLIDWLADSELVVHETSPGPAHTNLAELRKLPEALREKMLVVHLPDDVLGLESEVDLEFAEEGQVYEVG
jgi:ribonuclease BN (tRNA processing enzyme)